MSNKPESTTATGVFTSEEFLAFLSKDSASNKPSSPFRSKDSFVNNLETSSIFKSKDSFSNLFASSEWEMKYTAPSKSASQPEDSDGELKTFEGTTQEQDQPAAPVAVTADAERSEEEHKSEMASVMKSGDWMVNNTLGSHVDIPLSTLMFSKESPSSSLGVGDLGDQKLSPVESPRVETQWDEVFLAQLRPLAPAAPAVQPPVLLEAAQQLSAASASPQAAAVVAAAPGFVSFQANAAKTKRKRAPRKKIVPETKEYVSEPTQHDIVCGRGGRSNHHPGNKRYREEVDNLKEWYNTIQDKDEKTSLSQCLVDYVKSYGARFLDRDAVGWYVIDDITARRKVSQALREDTDPEKRHAKRQRFLAKRARLQQGAAARGNASVA